MRVCVAVVLPLGVDVRLCEGDAVTVAVADTLPVVVAVRELVGVIVGVSVAVLEGEEPTVRVDVDVAVLERVEEADDVGECVEV